MIKEIKREEKNKSRNLNLVFLDWFFKNLDNKIKGGKIMAKSKTPSERQSDKNERRKERKEKLKKKNNSGHKGK